MNLDELQSVQARERQSSDLQQLRPSFYREVGAFVQELTEQRARVVEEVDDPFSSPKVRQLTDDIETAEQTVEAIYERRIGKVVKKASIAAAGMPVDDAGLTDEEERLFEDLVDRIEDNRDAVLSVLDGDGPDVSCSIDGAEQSKSGTEPTAADASKPNAPTGPDGRSSPSAEDGVSAADLMGSGSDEGSDSGEPAADTPVEPSAPHQSMPSEAEQPTASDPEQPAPPEPEQPSTATAEQPIPPEDPPAPNPEQPSGDGQPDPPDPPEQAEATDGGTAAADPSTEPAPDATETASSMPGLPRTTVRITADVGEIVGADDRDYELGSEDVVTLPEPNAEVLVEKNAAERLD